jgi:putative oxidoreductase
MAAPAPRSNPVGSSSSEPRSTGGLLALLFGTGPHAAGLLLRLTLAVVIFPHGAQKVLGWFGGGGWSGTMEYFTGTVGLPMPLAALVMLIEFLGPIALLFGFLVRPAALGLIAVMVGAIVKVHLPNGFFMNWFGKQAGEGFEYHLLVIGMALALLVSGAGCCSIDRKIGGDAGAS